MHDRENQVYDIVGAAVVPKLHKLQKNLHKLELKLRARPVFFTRRALKVLPDDALKNDKVLLPLLRHTGHHDISFIGGQGFNFI